MSILRFDCRFNYPGGFALDLAFSAERGVTALVGPSGSGKTTVLNLIAGLLAPTEGVITLGDETLFSSTAVINLPPNRRDVGYVLQDYQLFPHLSVAENLRYGQRRARRPSASFSDVVATLELGKLLNRSPASLSGGQSQRVAVGRALLRSPRILLLDEPTNALDVDMRRNVGELVTRVIETYHVPTLLVSHDRDSVASLADATLELAGGSLTNVGR
jgi:molybdate transport system ATP-binding protein